MRLLKFSLVYFIIMPLAFFSNGYAKFKGRAVNPQTIRPSIHRAPLDLRYRNLIFQTIQFKHLGDHYLEKFTEEHKKMESLRLDVQNNQKALPHGVTKSYFERFKFSEERPLTEKFKVQETKEENNEILRAFLIMTEQLPSSKYLELGNTKSNESCEINVIPLIEGTNVVKISTAISRKNLIDKNNSWELQEENIKEIIKKLKKENSKSITVITPYEKYLDMPLLIKNLKKNDFAVKMVSSPERFEFNMERIRNRKSTKRVVFFDFSPHKISSMEEMNLPTKDLQGWKANSYKIKKLINKSKIEDIHQPESTIDGLFQELSKDNGAVVIIYGHADGKNMFLDTPNGVVTLSRERIIEELGEFGEGAWLPPVVLLNCESEPILAEAFLEASAPIVFASDQKIPIYQVYEFLKELVSSLNKFEDALDAIYDAIQKKGPSRFGPISYLIFPISNNSFLS